MYRLELYPGPMIPPAKPCRPASDDDDGGHSGDSYDGADVEDDNHGERDDDDVGVDDDDDDYNFVKPELGHMCPNPPKWLISVFLFLKYF